MLATYKYAVRKIATGKVTWIILLIGIALGFGIAGYLPMTFRLSNYSDSQRAAIRLILAYTLGFGEVMILVVAIFAAFRAGSVYRDELHDGSFLIMLSKPIKRSTLVLSKWLAFVSSLFLYCLLLAAAHTLGVATGSRFTENALRLLSGLGLVWAVGVLFAVLFSGVALFLSTFLSSAKTSAAVLALAFIFPASGLIGQTQVNRELLPVPRNGSFHALLSYVKPLEGGETTNLETTGESIARILKSGKEVLTSGTQEQKDALFGFMGNIHELGGLAGPISLQDMTPDGFERIVTATDSFGDSYLTSFFNATLYTPSHEVDRYLSILPFDFNGQAIALTHYVFDTFYDRVQQNRLATVAGGVIGIEIERSLPDKRVELAKINEMLEQEAVFSPPAYVSTDQDGAWLGEWQKWNEKYFADAGGAIYTVKYEPYHNRDKILGTYLGVGGGLTLVAILLIKRKNFA